MGAIAKETEDQVDTYLRHPCRDFRATDEALRIRRIQGNAFVTYKGPRLGGPVKVRPEIELPLAPHSEEGWLRIWQALGFVVAATVAKRREVMVCTWKGTSYTIGLDTVEGVGVFAEIELIVHDLSERESAQAQIGALASVLNLHEVETRSYLSMVLGQTSNAP